MAIPSLHKWLVTKYPKAVASAIEGNPDGLQFDNLYLDVNGIIHPCFHPDNPIEFRPATFEELLISVFEYVDKLIEIVRPTKLIYFAIDGVAPRAKLNQQRVGGYRPTKNDQIVEEEDRLRNQYEREGKKLLPKVESQLKDSNIISPGTEFMYDFSKALKDYIQTRLRQSPAWMNLKVILSDANVPGEGEHKIMSFIRSQRSLPHYDVNTRHCLHGLDADLILLALVTHELHISILRETNYFENEDAVEGNPSGSCNLFPVKKTYSFQFLHVWILREYLELDMRPSEAPEGFEFDIERAVDDFVFLSFFLGNDFLPHLPSLGTHEKALDLLMMVYKRDFKSLGGYIVDAQRVNDPKDALYLNLERVERLILAVGSYENEIFKKRAEATKRRSKKRFPKDDSIHSDNIVENTKKLKEEVRNYMWDKSYTVEANATKIECGTAGWKEIYYREKIASEDHDNQESLETRVVKEYVKGLCWILLYYYSGVPSWSWFYPYHYGPCASDFKGFGELEVEFEQGSPFQPFDQLIAVLPPRCVDILPKAYRNLMTDLNSDIASFYPREIHLDMDGKKFLWQGVVILPFIDEKRLLAATEKAKGELTEYEAKRNMLKSDLLFVRASSEFGYQLLSEIDENRSDAKSVDGFVNLNLRTSLDSSEGEDMILCVDFALAKPSIVVPRVPEHVKFPDKRTVYESDIEETVLWHDQYHRHFRTPRFAYQTRFPGPQEKESTRKVAPDRNSREGLYNHPDRFKNEHSSYSTRGRNNAWSPRYASNQESFGSRGGRFWPRKDSVEDFGAPKDGRFDRW